MAIHIASMVPGASVAIGCKREIPLAAIGLSMIGDAEAIADQVRFRAVKS